MAKQKQADNPLDVTEFEVLWVPVGTLTHNPKNYRKHDPDHILTLRQSLREHGWQQVVTVDPRDPTLILDGHGRELAAQAEGLATMPVHVYHGKSPEKWIVTANESDRQATVDQTALAALLCELQPTDGLEGTGWNDGQLDALVGQLAAADHEASLPDAFKEVDPTDDAFAHKCPRCNFEWNDTDDQ